ncbi:pentatricopeptide repeat-containing protein At2g46050, mitochondrial isoform X2 [Tripterygium wilfordii]|uniref:pentatricopeptide repeat-containing protein At2g46050, mitochondrial isoform X2 n=1 Tax=Tripterygium wilfordii TaxID=458696 RepID=UPI0018F83783|nr:pentatricopeptide repeat-containing protein At2g46050, mitochondrial isoform X2 [Tripterygium wilfordii]
MCKWRPPSISYVRTNRKYTFTPFPPSILDQNTKYPVGNDDPHHHLQARVPQLGSSIELTRHRDPRAAYTFCSRALKLSAKTVCVHQGEQLHGHIIKLGLYNEPYLQNQILHVYVRCGEFVSVNKVFDEISKRNVVTFNTVICGILDCNSNFQSISYVGFSYFRRMLLDQVPPDHVSFNGLFRMCVELNHSEIGIQLHCLTVKLGFDSDCFAACALVDLYGKCGLVENARRVFDRVLHRDLVFWNVMLSCYALNCSPDAAFWVFKLMLLEGVKGDGFTFSSLLSSCSTLEGDEMGRQVHCLVVELSCDTDVLVASTLIDVYAKNNNIHDARKVFDGMASKNVVSWTTMIVGYGQQGDQEEAMRLFGEIIKENFVPDELTLASILSSCGNFSTSIEVLQVHAYVIKHGFQEFPSVANALINSYSKSGSIAHACQCFSLVTDPDLVTWTSIIGAYAFHGLSEHSVDSFEKMLSAGVTPDEIAFLVVLSACSHGGQVSDGLHYFNMMINDHQIMPRLEHYTCLIDLLGRAGLLDEAFRIMTSMPVNMGSNTLGAFLGACKVHGNVGMARLRRMMKDMCDNKVPGCSWVEISGKVYTFVSSDKSHLQASEVYDLLQVLLGKNKEEYRVPYVDINV